MNYTRSDFPESFLFGLSASEPGAETQTKGFDSFRFPIHWHEVLPRGRGQPDGVGVARVERLVETVLERGMRPCAVLDATLVPSELADLGGWRNRDTADWYADFSELVTTKIGDRLFSTVSKVSSEIATDQDSRSLARTLHHRLLANGRANRAMRSLGMSNLGVEIDLQDPGHATLLSAIFSGSYPQDFRASLSAHLPTGWEQDFSTIATPVDWLGTTVREPRDLKSLTPLIAAETPDTAIYVSVLAESESDLVNHVDAILSSSASMPISGLFVQAENQEVLEALQAALTSTELPAPWVKPTGTVHDHWNLIADVGGTNTRLGISINGTLTELHKYPTGTLEDLREALVGVREKVGTAPQAVVAAGAGPVHNGTIHLTNANLMLSEVELARATDAERTFVINDFTAAAWSVADISDADVAVLQGANTPPAGTRLVVGPGTGLGVGALLYSEGRYHTVSGEGGHMGLSPRHRGEVDVFDAARHIAPDCFFDNSLALEAEMFLSGTGLPILYQAVGVVEGQVNSQVKSAKDILQTAQDGTDACAVKAARIFTEHLGAIMGDLAVALIPVGGVFLVGGVAEKNRWLFGQDFLDAFNAGGRFKKIRRSMNLYISEQKEFGIVGANNFCKNALVQN
ncbi:family 1 glycosylhydrolase [Ruegeria arenilitoris]|uniref:family 1 glycosylhydrolase n=1 Tax=Ruegeria arenilitoris TaxID=1173585 RepID=UPI0014811A19|nr:family 1 glycosylhydrolase [Ruegeria arenilitoris]